LSLKPEKLDALTSLRFFAAAIIVLHHSIENFKFGTDFLGFLPTFQAVSFFFVLSGFILTYVYRDFDDHGSLRRFFVARIARIWPLHVAMLLLTLVLLPKWFLPLASGAEPLKLFWLPLLSNLCLVQSWVPFSEYYFSFNAVSWSISVEAGFYLLFPLLLAGIRRHCLFVWFTTLLFTFALACVLDYLSSITAGVINSDTIVGIIQFNPLARIFEFTSGMVMALLYDKVKDNYKPEVKMATIIELISLMLVIVGIWLSAIIGMVIGLKASDPRWLWAIVGNANVVFVAPFILLMALGKGKIAKTLSLSVFVFLGEISFSLYLLHQIILRVYSNIFRDFILTPMWFNYFYFVAIVLLGSYLLWQIIEKPCRWLIINRNKSRWLAELKRNISARATDKHFLISVPVLAVLLVFLVLVPMKSGVTEIDKEAAHLLLTDGHKDFFNIRFGDGFLLNGVLLEDEKKPSVILIWESLDFVQLKYRVAVHFLDVQKKIISQADFEQSRQLACKVKAHTFWVESIDFSTIPENVCSIGLALYTPIDLKLLPISNGPRDWDNRRLIIPIVN